MKANGDTNRIKDVAWCMKSGSLKFATAGTKHIYFWETDGNKRKGIFNRNPMTSFSCVVWDSDEFCYTGGANGGVYKWGTDRLCMKYVQAHKKGCFVSAMCMSGGKLYSGSKDKTVCVIDPATMSTIQLTEVESMPRAIDNHNGQQVIGMRNGTICIDGKDVMKSHCDGEVWGLDYIPGQGPITSADDNRVMFWDPDKRCCRVTAKISDRRVNDKRGGA